MGPGILLAPEKIIVATTRFWDDRGIDQRFDRLSGSTIYQGADPGSCSK
jgi:hypothetical protein